ncbi:DUF4097 family beta strand repeat-containing protein [Staphylococcus shinii]|uniref:DUF4097 family beta strand repeat-containing protein n=1 Tax=Staphylococcus shinii TaxID=2912228 RepID=UPI003F55E07C
MRKLFFSGLALFIVCFALGCITWFGFEKQNNKLNTVNKNIDDLQIKELNIDAQNSSIKLHEGSNYSVKYRGENKLNISKQGKKLSIEETNNRKDSYGLNFNPFRKINDNMEITVPKETLDKLEMSSKTNLINVSNIKTNSANISMKGKGNAKVNLNNSSFEHLHYQGLNSPININKSKLINANIKTNKANITSEESLIKYSILLAQDGDVKLRNMDIDSAFKASSQNGDIIMSYNKKPDNTLLKLNPDDGVEKVNNKSFDNDRVGEGDNILEFYTVHGDIHIN